MQDVLLDRHGRPRLELAYTVAGILVTLVLSALVVVEQVPVVRAMVEQGDGWAMAASGLFFALVAFMVYGGLVYQFTRLGYVLRRMRLQPVAANDLDSLFADETPTLTILVPSFKEERRVILQTLMSAALQEYPQRRVVLLIDNPPRPDNAADAHLLAEARELPNHLQAMLAQAARRFTAARTLFERRCELGTPDVSFELDQLCQLWCEAAGWFKREADGYEITDHIDRLYVDEVLRARAARHLAHAEALAARVDLDVVTLRREYNKLASLFQVEIASFERKCYLNLSHEANKAMNLNSYMGLIGKAWRERNTTEGRLLEPAADEEPADLVVPAADYFITLDADSILLPDYALRLIHFMQQPENARVAVAQTPYSAIPGAPGVLERIAGATTDIQYIIHQGFTRFNATFWVGANALLRARAL